MKAMPSALKWLGGWVLGGLTAFVVAVGLGLFVVFSGVFDVTASTPHHPLIAWATHTTMMNSVRARAKDAAVPASFTPAQVTAGFAEYDRRCAACHGGPGVSRAPFAAAMTPGPPYLLDAARRWSPAELHLIVHDGVKMTAMPAWGEVEREDQIWDLVAFLEALPRLTARDYANLRAAAAQPVPFLQGGATAVPPQPRPPTVTPAG